MKKLIIAGLLMSGLLFSCDKECEYGFEGDDCNTEVSAKFIGDYDVDFTGSGAFSSSTGSTTAEVSEGDTPSKIQIDVVLPLTAQVLGSDISLPLEVSVQADVVGNEYSIPKTQISTEVQGIAVDIIFELEGELDGDDLDSELEVSGTLAGSVSMEGEK